MFKLLNNISKKQRFLKYIFNLDSSYKKLVVVHKSKIKIFG